LTEVKEEKEGRDRKGRKEGRERSTRQRRMEIASEWGVELNWKRSGESLSGPK